MWPHRVAYGYQSLRTPYRRATSEWLPDERIWRVTFASDRKEAVPDPLEFSMDVGEGDEETRRITARDECEGRAAAWVQERLPGWDS